MSWEPIFGLLMLATTAIDYTAARYIETATRSRKRIYLGISLFANLGILFFFKYFSFVSENLASLLKTIQIDYQSPMLEILLPVGISFYTFQSISYIVDVYRGGRSAEKHLGIYALYVSFFPQLVAGPIESSKHLLPQFYKKIGFSRERVVSGLRLALWGFFKKIVIADNAARIVNAIYGDPSGANGLALALATFFFAVQIYADFSGYSDIARGTARILGYDLMLNFRQPYFASSVREFWNRWHISLMKWFREYLYIPLGGSRVSEFKLIRNILIVFLISGIWHGANWTFIVWGLLNGFLIVLERILSSSKHGEVKKPSLFQNVIYATQILYTFIAILIGWVFFRSETVTVAVNILRSIGSEFFTLVTTPTSIIPAIYETRAHIPMTLEFFGALIIAIAILFAVDLMNERGTLQKKILHSPKLLRIAGYYFIIVYILLYGYFGKSSFIYFQF